VLNVLVVTENEIDQAERDGITDWIGECSTVIDEQVGIVLNPNRFIVAGELPYINDRPKRLTALYRIGKAYDDWDMMIEFAGYSASDILLQLLGCVIPVPTYHGYIDDTYRRVIVLKTRSKRIAIHEFFHAFILSHEHSDEGVMQAMGIILLPFTPQLNNTLYLCESDRQEVIKNKWRDFSVKPAVTTASTDFIEEAP
jgi:hypothetical protein